MQPFGYINTTDLIGVGKCNNPFYKNRRYDPNPAVDINVVTANSIPPRSGFGNHAFVQMSNKIYDACAGPHLGTESLSEYILNAIDQTLPKGTDTDVKAGSINDIK